MSSLRAGRRTAAILAILLLVATALSDFVIAGFWVSAIAIAFGEPFGATRWRFSQ
jgi:hypothetical protein